TRPLAPNFRCWLSARTIRLAKRLKTIELHIKRTLDSQIESREYEVAVPTCETAQNDIGVSFCNRRSAIVRMRTTFLRPGTSVSDGGAKGRLFIALQRSPK